MYVSGYLVRFTIIIYLYTDRKSSLISDWLIVEVIAICSMDIRAKVGQRIKELRKDLGLTQEAFSFKAEVDKTYINEVENGKRNISVVNLEKVIHALEISVSDFFAHAAFAENVKGGRDGK